MFRIHQITEDVWEVLPIDSDSPVACAKKEQHTKQIGIYMAEEQVLLVDSDQEILSSVHKLLDMAAQSYVTCKIEEYRVQLLLQVCTDVQQKARLATTSQEIYKTKTELERKVYAPLVDHYLMKDYRIEQMNPELFTLYTKDTKTFLATIVKDSTGEHPYVFRIRGVSIFSIPFLTDAPACYLAFNHSTLPKTSKEKKSIQQVN